MDTEEPLAGGHVAFVVRVGDTIRRPAGPWTPAVHGLLRHLDAVGFEAAPRVLGLDDKNREVLAYIEGDTLGDPPWPTWVWEDDLLEQIGRCCASITPRSPVSSPRPTPIGASARDDPQAEKSSVTTTSGSTTRYFETGV